MSGADVDTAEGVVVDGANRVGRRDRTVRGGAVFVLGALFAAVVLSRRRPAVARAAVAALAVACAGSGFRALLVDRADAPVRLGQTAAAVARLGGSLDSFARAHGCARVVANRCVACDPVARFALAGTAACAVPARIVLREGALGGRCIERDGTLECGSPPDGVETPTPSRPPLLGATTAPGHVSRPVSSLPRRRGTRAAGPRDSLLHPSGVGRL